MRLLGLLCGIAGGLLAFVLALLDMTIGTMSSAGLWLLAAGVIGMFGGGAVDDSPMAGSLLMAGAAFVTSASGLVLGPPVIAPALLLVAGTIFAWGSFGTGARDQIAALESVPARRDAQPAAAITAGGELLGRVDRLLELGQEASERFSAHVRLVRRERVRRGRLKLY